MAEQMKPNEALEMMKECFKQKRQFNIELNGIFYTYIPGNSSGPAMLMKVQDHKVYTSQDNKWIEVFK